MTLNKQQPYKPDTTHPGPANPNRKGKRIKRAAKHSKNPSMEEKQRQGKDATSTLQEKHNPTGSPQGKENPPIPQTPKRESRTQTRTLAANKITTTNPGPTTKTAQPSYMEPKLTTHLGTTTPPPQEGHQTGTPRTETAVPPRPQEPEGPRRSGHPDTTPDYTKAGPPGKGREAHTQ